MAAAIRAYVGRGESREVAIAAGNLSELLLTLGRLDEATSRAREAVAHADRSGDEFQRMSKRTTIADALHQQGHLDGARALFAEAEKLQAVDRPGTHTFPRSRASGTGSCSSPSATTPRPASAPRSSSNGASRATRCSTSPSTTSRSAVPGSLPPSIPGPLPPSAPLPLPPPATSSTGLSTASAMLANRTSFRSASSPAPPRRPAPPREALRPRPPRPGRSHPDRHPRLDAPPPR